MEEKSRLWVMENDPCRYYSPETIEAKYKIWDSLVEDVITFRPSLNQKTSVVYLSNKYRMPIELAAIFETIIGNPTNIVFCNGFYLSLNNVSSSSGSSSSSSSSSATNNYGLFTYLQIPKGTVFGQYTGVTRSQKDFNALVKKVPMKFVYALEKTQQKRPVFIDPTDAQGKPLKKHIFAFVNEPPENMTANCFVTPLLRFVSCQTILPETELLWNYGLEYQRNNKYVPGKACR